MRPRTFVFITMMVLCHRIVVGQTLTNAAPPAQSSASSSSGVVLQQSSGALPDDPGQEILPVAEPEPAHTEQVPVSYDADSQEFVGSTLTLTGVRNFRYLDYVLSADKIVWHKDTTEVEAEGHLRLTGGPYDIVLTGSHGDLRLNMHTARFYDVHGTMGVRSTGRTVVYSTVNPFVFSGRVLLQTGEGKYRIVDGTMTNCRLPRPDWMLFSRTIKVEDEHASMSNAVFRLLGIPIFYLPYVGHPTSETGRSSGFLIPVIPSNYNTIRGFTTGEQFYWAINRSTDMVIGTEYYSKRGFAPNGDFRYRGVGLDHLTARWNALLDRGFDQVQPDGSVQHINQGGVDVLAEGRRQFSPETRLAGNVEYLSSYVYRLVFTDNYWQAISSMVRSELSLTHAHNGFIPSVDLSRLQNFASSNSGDEVRILHLPTLRYDILDRPLVQSPFYLGFGSSMGHLGRSEPGFHSHNEGRTDLYPHVSLPIVAGGWSIVPEAALRETFYSTSQIPGADGAIPTVSHTSLNRSDAEASIDIRPPAMERDFTLGRSHRTLRHVIEPEFNYRFVGGIGTKEQRILQVDTTDIATNTNQVGFSLMQRFYLKSNDAQPCTASDETQCPPKQREWASWQIAQDYFFDPEFGGALIPGQRNVFDPTLNLTGIAFLTSPHNLSPVVSRLRFEAINNLRIEWDLDYDPRAGRIGADNVFAGYSRGITTVGIGHSILNAVDEQGSTASLIQSQQINPFLEIGKQNRQGFNLAANGGYDVVHGALQYAGVLGVYNWDCCGISLGYRRFDLGSIRGNDVQYLYGFTFANFGSAGDVRHTTTVFRDPAAPPAF